MHSCAIIFIIVTVLCGSSYVCVAVIYINMYVAIIEWLRERTKYVPQL